LAACCSSGGSPFLSAISRATFAISFADLIHHHIDLAPHHQIVRAPRRYAAQMRENNPRKLSINSSTSARRTSSRFFSINRSCSISVLTLT
jgi:hypothetical protein